MEKLQKKVLIQKLILLAIFITAIAFFVQKYSSQILGAVADTNSFRDLVLSYGDWGILVLIGFQILQVVLSVIPGEVIQMVGGYIYGIPYSIIYLLIGTNIGGILVFSLSRYIGYPLVEIFVSKEKFEKLSFLLKSKKAEVVIFLLFIMPAIPKDTLIYIAGLTPIKPLRFFVILLLARMPGIIITAYIGASLVKKDYTTIYILVGLIVLLLSVGIIYRKRVMTFFEEKYSDKT
jgi:uncharacterized membrane protein YdjX (TVP38/TMEM64 family)